MTSLLVGDVTPVSLMLGPMAGPDSTRRESSHPAMPTTSGPDSTRRESSHPSAGPCGSGSSSGLLTGGIFGLRGSYRKPIGLQLQARLKCQSVKGNPFFWLPSSKNNNPTQGEQVKAEPLLDFVSTFTQLSP